MPFPKDLLDILVCPATKQPLEILAEDKRTQLTARIAQGQVKNAGGNKVETPVEEGLITVDGLTIYRIDDGIPNMLVEEGIPAAQID